MIIGRIEWETSFLMSTKNKKIASYCAVILWSWVNGSMAVTHDPCDPSKKPMTHWPISISATELSKLVTSDDVKYLINPHGVVNWVEVRWVRRPESGWDKIRRLLIQQRYCVWIHCCKRPNYDVCISQGSVATVFKWGGQNYRPNYSHLSYVSSCFVACQKLLKSAHVSRSYSKNNTGIVFLRHGVFVAVRCGILL